jgi:hypothetical protein
VEYLKERMTEFGFTVAAIQSDETGGSRRHHEGLQGVLMIKASKQTTFALSSSVVKLLKRLQRLGSVGAMHSAKFKRNSCDVTAFASFSLQPPPYV